MKQTINKGFNFELRGYTFDISSFDLSKKENNLYISHKIQMMEFNSSSDFQIKSEL